MHLISDGGASCNTKDTLEAIMLTKNIDYIDGIKLDIWVTLDNMFVVAISDNLSDFTLSNKKISEVEYNYLKKVKFPSHIFKYYIPLLEEILLNYNKNKIIILEINKISDEQKNLLYSLLSKYSYKYYYLVDNNNLINDKLLEIGSIIKDYIKTDVFSEINNNSFIISKYPEKISRKLKYRQF